MVECSHVGYTELKGLDVFEFMILYNQKVNDSKKYKNKKDRTNANDQ